MKFDLIYVEQDGERTMTCGIVGDGVEKMIGPFPAKDAARQIVAALMAEPGLGLTSKEKAEAAYTVAHFRNMSRGTNDAGQSYPYRISE